MQRATGNGQELKLTLSSHEAAELLGVSERHLATIREPEGIPYIRLGRRVLYPREALAQWVADRVREGAGDDRD